MTDESKKRRPGSPPLMRVQPVVPPCKDCADRHVGCHGKCEKYAEFNRVCEKTRDERRLCSQTDTERDRLDKIVAAKVRWQKNHGGRR